MYINFEVVYFEKLILIIFLIEKTDRINIQNGFRYQRIPKNLLRKFSLTKRVLETKR